MRLSRGRKGSIVYFLLSQYQVFGMKPFKSSVGPGIEQGYLLVLCCMTVSVTIFRIQKEKKIFQIAALRSADTFSMTILPRQSIAGNLILLRGGEQTRQNLHCTESCLLDQIMKKKETENRFFLAL